MSDNRISYLNRTFDDYKQSLKNYISQYYPQIASDLNDASIGSWLVDMVAAIGDNLSYYIDKAYNETNIDTAQQRNSVYNLARSAGLKIPGPKGSVALCEFSVEIPANGPDNSESTLGVPPEAYLPVIKKGTKVSSRSQVFEVMNDIDFSEEYDYNGFANRSRIPITDSQNRILKYKITKRELVYAGESRIYKQVINNVNDIHPFMEVVIPDTNVMSVESVIFKMSDDYQSNPSMAEFMVQSEQSGSSLFRFFEVNSLADTYRWGDSVTGSSSVESYKYDSWVSASDVGVPVYSIAKGEWKPITQKFITEFTDNGYLKIIFGSGEQVGRDMPADIEETFTKYQISKIIKNNFLGKLPRLGSTMYVLYRVGGGAASNVAANTITNIEYLDLAFTSTVGLNTENMSNVRRSVTVTNPYPSVTGKDAPSVDEIRAMIKYNSAAQERCVTVKDYENRIMLLPARYGTPFRVRAAEENNKIMLYMLGINADGTLSNVLPEQLIKNIINYLSMYRSVNDFIEMKSGRIVNIAVDADLFIDKAYNAYDVIAEVIKVIKDFFDINKHQLGDTIYLSKLTKAITDIGGVLNLTALRIYNKTGAGYSTDMSVDPIIENSEYTSDDEALIDIDATGYQLNSDMDAMFEIKNPDKDIRVRSIIKG